MNENLVNQVADRCEQASCSEKIAKVHYEQARLGWDAHPSQDFCAWWAKHPDYREGILSRIAWNCECYRQQYLEAKSVGIT